MTISGGTRSGWGCSQSRLHVITLTGPNPNALADLADAAIHAPGDTTAIIQTNNVASYHRFCQLIENATITP